MSSRKMMKTACLLVGSMACAVGLLLILQSPQALADQKDQKKKMDYAKAYAVYRSKCLGCHDSVADPEKAGRTRDDWYLVVNVMHGYGLTLTNEETESITDLLYRLRRGLEKEAG